MQKEKDCCTDTTSVSQNGTNNRLVHRIEDFFTSFRKYIIYIHWGMFFFFIALMLIPPFLPYPPENATPLNNLTLFATFVFWGVWFPLTLLSVVFFGRAWCGLVCPQGAISEQISKVGLNRKPPSWIRWEGTPILSFVIVTILGQLVSVREYPLPMLEILGGTMALALIVGFIYTKRHRTWCRYLCPIGLLLGIFSRLGIVSFEGSLTKKRNNNGSNSICPTFIDLSQKETSRHCIECFICPNWKKKNALSLTFRKPGKEIEDIAHSTPSLYEVIFLFGATGLALGAFHWQSNPFYITYKWTIGSFLLDLNLGQFISTSGPWWIMSNHPESGEVFNWLDFIAISTFMLGVMVAFLVVLSLLNYLSSSLVYRNLKGKVAKKKLFARLGYVYTPVALISLFLGLGATLFQSLETFGLNDSLINSLRAVIFFIGILWSIYLTYKVIENQGAKKVFLPCIPQFIGILLITIGWYSSIML